MHAGDRQFGLLFATSCEEDRDRDNNEQKQVHARVAGSPKHSANTFLKLDSIDRTTAASACTERPRQASEAT